MLPIFFCSNHLTLVPKPCLGTHVAKLRFEAVAASAKRLRKLPGCNVAPGSLRSRFGGPQTGSRASRPALPNSIWEPGLRAFFAAIVTPPGTILKKASNGRASNMATAQLGTLLRHIQRLAGEPAGSTRRLTDRQLVDDFALHRHESAFAALVARHGPMVLQVCRRV